jgi:hypothetical protein
LASFTNVEGGAERASRALTKALLGERESVKELGIAILEEDVKAKIKSMEATGELTNESTRQKKAMATLAIAMEQSKNAIGDFARTQDQTANQMKVMGGRIKDIKVALGQSLLPPVTAVIKKFNELTRSTGEWMRFIKQAPIAFERLGLRAKLFADNMMVNFRAIEQAVKGNLIGGLKTARTEYADLQNKFALEDEKLKKKQIQLVTDLANADKKGNTEITQVKVEEGQKQKDISKDVAEAEKNDSEDTKKKRIDDLKEYVSQSQSIMSAFTDLLLQDEQNKLDLIKEQENEHRTALALMDEEDKKRKLADLQAEVFAARAAGDMELADEKQREIQRMKLEKQAQERDKQIKIEAAKQERKITQMKKTSALIKIAIETARAIAEAIPNPITMSLAAVLGAVQAATVKAQPLPEIPAFAMGGTLGGLAGRDRNMFAGSRGETILNTSQGQNLFNSLESAGLLSGGNTVNNMTNNNQNMSRNYSIGTVVNQGGNEFDDQVNQRLSQGGDFI